MSVRVQTKSRSTSDHGKRTRISLACDSCRDRKVRCDGRKPICSTCLRRRYNNSQCVYGTIVNPGRLDSQREYIKALHDKIQYLEATAQPATLQVADYGSSLPFGTAGSPQSNGESLPSPFSHRLPGFGQHPSANLTATPSMSAAQDEDRRSWKSTEWLPKAPTGCSQVKDGHTDRSLGVTAELLGGSQEIGIKPTAPFAGAESPRSIDHEDNINAMGAICSKESLPESPKESYYGQSSIVSLQHQVSSATSASNSLEHSALPRGLPATMRRQAISSRRSAESFGNMHQFSLPPRNLADHLLDQFWAGVYHFYPWIHRPSFLKSYQSLWTGSEPEVRDHRLPRIGLGGRDCPLPIYHGALNAIFALGCEFAPSQLARDESLGAEFMSKAYKLVRIDLLDKGGLALVQTLLIIAIYLQSTQHSMRCWGVSGLALRIAQGIGLHTTTQDSHFSMLELEMRRRAWHGCILMDRMVSMTLGRPPSPLIGLNVPLFSAIDDEYLANAPGQCIQPAGTFSLVAFAVQNVRLGELLGRILNQFYQHHAGDIVNDGHKTDRVSCGSIIDAVTSLEDSLCSFEAHLPAQLRWDASIVADNEDELLRLRQRCVLHARAAHVKLMLYRPFFAAYCNRALSPGLRGAGNDISAIFDRHCALACFESAGNLIETTHRGIMDGLFGAWWYALFYLVTAGMTLILAETTIEMRSQLDENDITRLWQLCYEALDRINQDHPMAGECTAALQKIKKRAWQIFQANLPTRHVPPGIVQHAMTQTRDMGSDPLIRDPKAAPTVLNNAWTFGTLFPEELNSTTDVDTEALESGDLASITLAQDLQNVFGDAVIPEIMWQALGQDYNAQSLYEPFV